MITELGFGALTIAFLLAGYGIFAAAWAVSREQPVWLQSAKNALIVMFPVLTLSVFSLLVLLINGHYEVAYVYQVSSENTPLLLRLTALWGGQAGSLLFWTWMLSIFSFVVMMRDWNNDGFRLPWVIILLLFIQVFFIGLCLFLENPFVRFWQLPGGMQVSAMFKPGMAVLLSPSDGRGLNPLLRHPGMVLHPPALYLGFTTFVIPYVFAMASLITGQRDERWLGMSRPWVMLAWLFLSAGLLLGSRWAYDVLGWGGYWAWDPVENAALMPWLLATALLHAIMAQEKRGLFKRWNMILVLLTFSMVLYGTFLTRSGVLSSVHAFSESGVGPIFFLFLSMMLFASLALLFYRWTDLAAEGSIHSFFSRESFFLFSNVLFFALFLVVFLGVNFPLLSELITGQKITVGPPWYEQTTGPIFALLLLLMALSPLTSWGYSTAHTLWKAVRLPLGISLLAALAGYTLLGVQRLSALLGFWLALFSVLVIFKDILHGLRLGLRDAPGSWLAQLGQRLRWNGRRYSAYLIHIGIALMVVGILGLEVYQSETQTTLTTGRAINMGSYQVELETISEFDTQDRRNIVRAAVRIWRDERMLKEVYPRRDFYYDSQQVITIPGIYSSVWEDLYVVLVDWEPINTKQATFRIFENRYVNWLWAGGIVLGLGGIANLASRKRRFRG